MIVRSLPPRSSRAPGAISHPKSSSHTRRGVLVVLDGVAQSLGDVVSRLGHVVVLQQREEPGVGWSATADGGLQSERDKLETRGY